MSSKSLSKPSNQNALALFKRNIPIQLTDLSIFDYSYSCLRDRFSQEMKRINQQTLQVSSDLTACLCETSGSGYGSPQNDFATTWQVLQNSPLVVGEGEEKTLKLQFDVSEFDPSEVKVELQNDMLVISASHEEKTKDCTVYRAYNRQFKLPPGIVPESLVSSLSRDGVLTIEASLLLPAIKK